MSNIVGWSLGNHLATYIGNECDPEERNIFIQSYGYKILRVSNDQIRVISENQEYPFSVNYDDFEGIRTGDVLAISNNGHYSIVYSSSTGEIDIFMTNKCNSNCIMCPLPEATRKKPHDERYIEWLNEFIDILPESVGYVNITGGEPTFFQKDFIDLLYKMKNKFKYAEFQLLTNGRSFSDKRLLDEVIEVSPEGLRFAIPIHASDEMIHDGITQADGSFRQTDKGIKNLLAKQQKVEIRIVISQRNKAVLTETAKYIISNYKGVFCVNFIGMEMMGNAAYNRKELWIDYHEAFVCAQEAIDMLVHEGVDVQLYNFPLCSLAHGYWYIAAKSITDYKIRYMEECESCEVRKICGGFFASTKQLMNPKVYPIKKKNED